MSDPEAVPTVSARAWFEACRAAEAERDALAAEVRQLRELRITEDETLMTIVGNLARADADAQQLRELAKNARSAAAAPDYDEEAIRAALWALVDAALAAEAAR